MSDVLMLVVLDTNKKTKQKQNVENTRGLVTKFLSFSSPSSLLCHLMSPFQ